MFTDCEKLRNFSESLSEWVQGYATRYDIDPDTTRVAFGSLLRSIIKGLARRGNMAAGALIDALVPSIDGAYDIAYGDLTGHLEAVIAEEEAGT